MSALEALEAPMTNKEFYKKKSEEHLNLYEEAKKAKDLKLMKYHHKEHLIYKKASES